MGKERSKDLGAAIPRHLLRTPFPPQNPWDALDKATSSELRRRAFLPSIEALETRNLTWTEITGSLHGFPGDAGLRSWGAWGGPF